MKQIKKGARGFTLIELLVVIGIIAVLSLVVILTLNPAELLRQARDSNRISDLNTAKSAVSLYLADVASPSLAATSTWKFCYEDLSSGSGSSTCPAFTGVLGSSTTNNRNVTGTTGWIPVQLSSISSGAPIGNWPIDPVNTNVNTFYTYTASTTSLTFKLAGRLESLKYNGGVSPGGANDVTTNDGGNDNYSYETGTGLSY